MNYVAHVCRSSKLKQTDKNYCDAIWIDKDLTKATVNPPTWKYCRDCCEKLGIDYDSQTPTSNLSTKELEARRKKSEKAKKNFHSKKS